MTLREGGILVSRGLAMFFLAQSLTRLLSALEYLPGMWGNRGWSTPVGYFAEAVLNFLFAGFLWRGAGSFTSDLPSPANGRPLDQGGLLRILVAGIAVYWLFNSANLLLLLATSYIGGAWRSSYMLGLIRNVVMIVAAGATIVWASKGLTFSRMVSYPRSEPDVEDTT